MSSPVDQIKDRLSIIDVVGSYLKLEKSGSNFKGCCPFHNEKTPSFFVSPARSTYHCFGCSKGGDIFSFVQDIEGVDFVGSLKILAERAGVDLVKENQGDNNKKNNLFKILEEATTFFQKELTKNKDVRDYLSKRGVRDDVVEIFRLGYAPNDWRLLVSYLRSKGFSDTLIEETGLILKTEKNIKDKYYDRFRNRIMFPIANSSGKIVGFSGRIFGTDENQAKYINSPETSLYNKSEILYGYDKAKRAIMQKDFCIIVEGQMDLVMSHQEGYQNTVAVSGTALTNEHLKIIKRFTDNLVLSFDSDEAGFNASERSVKLALSVGMEVKVVKMPKGFDPADLLLKDLPAWQEALKKSKHFIDFYLDFIEEKNLESRVFRKEVGKKVLPYLLLLKSSIDQGHFVKVVASRLGINESDVRDELTKLSVSIKNKDDKVTMVEKNEVTLIKPEDQLKKKFLGLYLWISGKKDHPIDLNIIKEKFFKITNLSLDEVLEKITESLKNNLIFQTELTYQDNKKTDVVLDELLLNLEKNILEKDLESQLREIKIAESKMDNEKAENLLKKCQGILVRIEEIKSSLNHS